MKNLIVRGGVRIPTPESYRDCIILVQSDLFRNSGRVIPLWRILISFSMSWMNPLFWLRLSEYKGWMYRWTKQRYNTVSSRRLINIPISTKIGYGLYLGHCCGVIVNKTAVIGNNVSIQQFVTIGSNHDRAATICDKVWIGPGCCVVEDVIIGEGSNIGAGAVVVKDVEEHSVAVGVPAKVVNHNPEPVIGNYYKIEIIDE